MPAAAITASATIMLIGVALNYMVPERVFIYVTSMSLVGSLWTWAMIVIARLGYRKAVAIGETRPIAYRMPLLKTLKDKESLEIFALPP